jgi:hypothetical protein
LLVINYTEPLQSSHEHLTHPYTTSGELQNLNKAEYVFSSYLRFFLITLEVGNIFVCSAPRHGWSNKQILWYQFLGRGLIQLKIRGTVLLWCCLFMNDISNLRSVCMKCMISIFEICLTTVWTSKSVWKWKELHLRFKLCLIAKSMFCM